MRTESATSEFPERISGERVVDQLSVLSAVELVRWFRQTPLALGNARMASWIAYQQVVAAMQLEDQGEVNAFQSAYAELTGHEARCHQALFGPHYGPEIDG